MPSYGLLMNGWTLGIAGMLVVSAAGAGCSDSKACTAIGCFDGVSVQVTARVWRPGEYTVAVTGDGLDESCTFSVAEGGTIELGGCTGEGAGLAPHLTSQTFSGVELALGNQHPARITIGVTRNGSEVASQSQALAYSESQPNGPDCGPPCRMATGYVIVPDA